MTRFRFTYDAVTYIDPDLHGWGQRGMVLRGRMETGSLRVGERVEVPTAAGFWNRAVTALADADLTKMGKPDEYHPVVFAGREPVEVMLYFGSQPPIWRKASVRNEQLQPGLCSAVSSSRSTCTGPPGAFATHSAIHPSPGGAMFGPPTPA